MRTKKEIKEVKKPSNNKTTKKYEKVVKKDKEKPKNPLLECYAMFRYFTITEIVNAEIYTMPAGYYILYYDYNDGRFIFDRSQQTIDTRAKTNEFCNNHNKNLNDPNIKNCNILKLKFIN